VVRTTYNYDTTTPSQHVTTVTKTVGTTAAIQQGTSATSKIGK